MMKCSSEHDVTSSITTRRAAPCDLEEIIALMRLALGEGQVPRSTEYWCWKHQLNPFGPSYCLIAEDAGRIVGLRAFMRWEWRFGERTLRAVRAVDTATHPEWQGRGIFRRLTTEMLDWVRSEGISFVFNTPNRRSGPGYFKMGWRSLGRVPVWVKPLIPVRILSSFQRLRWEATDEPAASVRMWAGIDSVCEAAGNGTSHSDQAPLLRTMQSDEYLLWRYARIPGIEYRRAVLRNEKGGAAAVYRMRGRGILTELRLAHFAADDDDSGHALDLLRGLFHARSGVFASAVASPNSPEAQLLRKLGFFPTSRYGPELAVLTLDASAELALSNLDRWRIAIGDLEIF
jgi:GNAT superfamily N-acetyltransferase